MRTHNMPSYYRKIKVILIMPPDLVLLSTLIGLNYFCLELILMVPKVFEPFYRIYKSLLMTYPSFNYFSESQFQQFIIFGPLKIYFLVGYIKMICEVFHATRLKWSNYTFDN